MIILIVVLQVFTIIFIAVRTAMIARNQHVLKDDLRTIYRKINGTQTCGGIRDERTN